MLIIGKSFLLLTLLLASCASSEDSTNSTSSSANASLKKPEVNHILASPNPVPAGGGNGTTTISWNVKDVPAEQVFVYVSVNGAPETLFAQGVGPTQDAPWIGNDSQCEFRLYIGTGANRKLLDKVIVTRNK